MTRPEVIELVAVLMAAYPSATFPDGSVAAYEQFLLELDRDRAREAVRNVVRSNKFMPSIAEVVSAYDALVPRQRDEGYRLFKPAPVQGTMAPSELKAEIDSFLKKAPQ